jgi:hypothetical protein
MISMAKNLIVRGPILHYKKIRVKKISGTHFCNFTSPQARDSIGAVVIHLIYHGENESKR